MLIDPMCLSTSPWLVTGVAMTETRQVIQVPGAPPISIRFGTRPFPPQSAQQVDFHDAMLCC